MKKNTAIFLLLLLSSAGMAQPATDIEKKTDEKAQLIRKYFNAKNIDSLYALMAPSFQEKISKQALEQGLIAQVLPLGKMVGFQFLSNQNGISKYKTQMASGVTLQTLVGINEQGQVSTFGIQPYKDPAIPKRTALFTDNPLKSSLDSIVDKAARDYMMDTITAGLSIAIHWQGADHYYNYGEADKGSKKSPSPQTIYEIGSITKTFVSYLLAKAVTENKLGLYTPITNYLPDSVAKNPGIGGIQMVHLANHTSGLPRIPIDLFAANGTKQDDPYALYSEAMLMKGLSAIKPTRKPGFEYEYSNYAMGLLATLISNTYEKPFPDLAKQAIFKPMKMQQTTAGNEISENMATGYNEKGIPTSYWTFQALAGAGSIKSNALDLLLYAKEIIKLMNANSPMAKLLMEPTFEKKPTIVSLGWHQQESIRGNRIFQHSGGTYGFRSQLYLCPRESWGVVALANHGADPGASGVAAKIIAQLQGLTK